MKFKPTIIKIGQPPFIFFVATLFILYSCGDSKYYETIRNDIEFSGYITKINVSDNHSFGILQVNLSDSAIKHFYKEMPGSYTFPYRIDYPIAEVYTNIPRQEVHIGQKITVYSNDKKVSYYQDGKYLFDTGLSVHFSDVDQRFIRENSTFRWEPK